MKKVGITGGIGSGKSIVCRVFSTLGIPIYDADSRAKALMTSSDSLIDKIKAEFGQNSYDSKGNLNRSFLASEVFSNEEKLEILNSLVHPEVGKDFEEWAGRQKAKYIIKEAALLIEAGSYKQLDKLIVITAPREIRIERVLSRDPHRDRDQVISIIEKQLSDKKKVQFADFVIDNDESHLLIPQILQIHNELVWES